MEIWTIKNNEVQLQISIWKSFLAVFQKDWFPSMVATVMENIIGNIYDE